jgi:hypothetical protein
MKIYSLYDSATGLFVGRTFGTDLREDTGEHARALAANTPAGHGTVEGVHDHLSKRVDLDKVAAARKKILDAHAATVATMRKNFVPAMKDDVFHEPAALEVTAGPQHVVDYQPPQPGADYTWNGTTRRWVLSAAAQASATTAAAAKARIAQLRDQQHDLLPSVVLGDAAAKEQLQALETEIKALQSLQTPLPQS